MYSIGPPVAAIGGERETKEKEAEREYRGTYPARRNSDVLAYGLYVDLAATKLALKTNRNTLQLTYNGKGKRAHKSNTEILHKHNPAKYNPLHLPRRGNVKGNTH